VVKEAAYPRLPTLRGKQRARAARVPVWTAADIGADVGALGLEGSPTRVVKIESPTVARHGQICTPKDPGQVEAAVEGIIAYMEKLDLL
jgi:electron transfer flavoprotein beta subunit